MLSSNGRSKSSLPAALLVLALVLLILAQARSIQAFAAAPAPPSPQRVIRFVNEDGFPPYSFLDSKGVPTGYDVEVARAAAQAAGVNCEVKLGAWDQAMAQVLAGRADAMSGITNSRERMREFDFTRPTMESIFVIFVGPNSPDLDSLADLKGKRLAVQRGGVLLATLARYPDINQVLVRDTQEGLDAVLERRADAFVGNLQAAMYYIRTEELEGLKVVGRPVLSQRYSMAVRKGDRETLSLLNRGIDRLRARGTLEALQRQWFGEAVPTRRWSIRDHWAMAGLGLALLCLVGLILLWNLALRRDIAARTRELELARSHMEDILGPPGETVLLTVSAQGRIESARGGLERLGWDGEDLPGKPLEAVFGPGAQILESIRARGAAGGFVQEVQAVVVPLKDGGSLSARLSLASQGTGDRPGFLLILSGLGGPAK